MKKPEFYVKKMINLENEVIAESRKFCRSNNIPFHKAHEDVIRKAMRQAVNYGVVPVFKEYIDEQKKILDGRGSR